MLESMVFSRRSFLKAAAASTLAGAAGPFISGCGKSGLSPDPADLPGQETTTKYSYCGVCGAACGMIAQVVGDRLQRLQGNPHDQVAQGKLCVKGYHSIKFLYDPDRLKFPLKRTKLEKGPGIDPGFVKISWEEAFQLTGEAFDRAVAQYGPQSLAIFSGPHEWLGRWQRAVGTPNRLTHDSLCFTTYDPPWIACVGTRGRPWTLDLANAKYLLSLGWDQPSKGKNMSARGYIKALENGAKSVVIDPRLTVTGTLADQWIPIKPGTDLAFCLAMIHIIVNEELYDKDFVEKYTSGLDRLKEGVQGYTPAWAEGICEIEASTIEKIAREFATTRPAMIPNHKRDAGGPNHANSWRVAFCTVILNSLVGSLDRPGGQIIQRTPPLKAFDAVFPPQEDWFPEMVTRERIDGYEKHFFVGPRQGGNLSTALEGILQENPYPVKAALVRKNNLLAFPNAQKAVEAIKKFDFVAVCDIIPSEMVQLADVVLPEPHFLETTGLGVRGYHALYPQVHLREAVVDPLYDTREFSDIVTGIAGAMGLGHIFQGVSKQVLYDERMKGLGSSWEQLKGNGTGVWSDMQPFKGQETFNTFSRKIELYATRLELEGYDPLPYWQPKREEPTSEFPFYFLISRAPMHNMTESQNNTLALQVNPENTLMINEGKAREMGIAEGDEVYVESRVGKIKLKAELIKGMRSDCVCVEHGFGHWSKGLSLAHNRGANDGDLIPDLTIEEMVALKDPGAGGCMNDFCVKVYKA